jgi:hypothetical protein
VAHGDVKPFDGSPRFLGSGQYQVRVGMHVLNLEKSGSGEDKRNNDFVRHLRLKIR